MLGVRTRSGRAQRESRTLYDHSSWRASTKIELHALASFARACPEAAFPALNIPSGGVRNRFDAVRSARMDLVKRALTMYVTLSDSGLRPVLGSWLKDRNLRRLVGRRELMTDLLHLGLLRRGAAGTGRHVASFDVDIYARKSAVQMISRAYADDPVRSTPEVGPLRSVIWNHSKFGEELLFRVTGHWSIRIHMPGGRYSFEAMTAMSTVRPELVRNAFFSPRQHTSAWSRVSLYPVHYAQKGYAALRAGLGDPALRRILRDARRFNVPWDVALEDILKLSLMRRHDGFNIGSKIEGRTLRIFSSRAGEPVSRATAAGVARGAAFAAIGISFPFVVHAA